MYFERILITTDFSECSYAAFDLAAYEAKEANEIRLLSVVEDWCVPEPILKQVPDPDTIAKYRKNLLNSAKERVQQLANEYFHHQKIKADALLSATSIAKEICDYAKHHQIHVIVMASHGRGAVGQFFLGSTAQKVIRQSPCPVLIIPKKTKQN